MQTSPWLPQQAGATATEYRGTRLAARMRGEDPAAAFPVAALSDWSFRATLELRGPETRRWLNGIVTANIRDLAPGHTASSFLLSPKGHILAQFDVACLAAERFVLLTTEAQRLLLIETLRRYIFRSQVAIEDLAEQLAALAICGPGGDHAVAAAGFAALPARGGFTGPVAEPASRDFFLFRWQLGQIETIEILGNVESMAPLYEALSIHAVPVGAINYDRRLLLEGVPLFGRDIREGILPPETSLMTSIGHNKGCYVGQEIVERIRARGQVHRQFHGFRFAGPIQAGDRIQAGDKDAGELTAVTPLIHGPHAGQWAALGYLRRDAEESGAPLATPAGVAGQIAVPPLDA